MKEAVGERVQLEVRHSRIWVSSACEQVVPLQDLMKYYPVEETA